jgi:hypothetical protein
MTFLTGLLPVAQGVAVHAALTRHADTRRAAGDQRGRGQIMADTLVERVTGQASATGVPVEVQLVMSDAALLGRDASAAHLHGYGPVPAPYARTWLADTDADVWVRRLYTRPDGHALVGMDSTRRTFTGGLRKFLITRDQTCRTPWCDAPIRHLDHPTRHAEGGRTTATNAQGLCAACNLAKEAPGWRAHATTAGHVRTRTPTGHRYTSPTPLPPASRPYAGLTPPVARSRGPSSLERRLRDHLLTA